jgi:hypothetical protein
MFHVIGQSIHQKSIGRHHCPHCPHTNIHILGIIRGLVDSYSYSNRTLVWGSEGSRLTADICQYGKNTVLKNAPPISRRLKQRGARRHTSCKVVQVTGSWFRASTITIVNKIQQDAPVLKSSKKRRIKEFFRRF